MEFDKLRAFAFDLDGTLFPYFYMILLSLILFVKHPRFASAFKNVRSRIREEIKRRGKRAAENTIDFRMYQASLLAEELGIPTDRAFRLIDGIIYNEWEDMFRIIKPFRGVEELLGALIARGKKIALLSDFPAHRKLSYLKLSSYFDLVMCSDESGFLKPHRAPFELLCKRLSLKPTEIIYIGNDPAYDVKGAKSVGMKTALIRSLFGGKRKEKQCHADIIFSNYYEFLDIIDN